MELYVILIIILIVLLYIVYNLLRKTEKYENIILDYNNELYDIQKKINIAHNTMKEVDLRGSFESDDEVGATFNILKEIISQLDIDIQQIEANGTITNR